MDADVIVIGAGLAGLRAARVLAERQQKQAEGVAGIRGYLSR